MIISRNSEQWYPVLNDMVGGWAIGTVNKPMSQYDFRPGSDDGRIICDGMTSEDECIELCKLVNDYKRLWNELFDD